MPERLGRLPGPETFENGSEMRFCPEKEFFPQKKILISRNKRLASMCPFPLSSAGEQISPKCSMCTSPLCSAGAHISPKCVIWGPAVCSGLFERAAELFSGEKNMFPDKIAFLTHFRGFQAPGGVPIAPAPHFHQVCTTECLRTFFQDPF